MIFISYSRNDKEFVNRLCRELEARDVSYWLDEKDILAGDSITEGIESGLREASFFCLCLSQSSVTRPWVLREYRAALNLQLSVSEKKFKIIPLLIQNCEVPELLRDIKYADFSQDFTDGLRSLCNALKIPLTPSNLQSPTSESSQEELNLKLFVGPKYPYYFSKLESMASSGRTVSFNWAAFFFTGFWMAYRKMYSYASLFILATSIIGFVMGFSVALSGLPLLYSPFVQWRLSRLSGSSTLLLAMMELCVMILTGLSANGLYFLHIRKKLTDIKLKGLSPIETQHLIQQTGGTSVGSVTGYFFLVAFFLHWVFT